MMRGKFSPCEHYIIDFIENHRVKKFFLLNGGFERDITQKRKKCLCRDIILCLLAIFLLSTGYNLERKI